MNGGTGRTQATAANAITTSPPPPFPSWVLHDDVIVADGEPSPDDVAGRTSADLDIAVRHLELEQARAEGRDRVTARPSATRPLGDTHDERRVGVAVKVDPTVGRGEREQVVADGLDASGERDTSGTHRDRVAPVHALAEHLEQRSLVAPSFERGARPLLLVGAPLGADHRGGIADVDTVERIGHRII